MSYSQEILDNLLISSGATLKKPPEKLHKSCEISFNCRCGSENTKKFVNAKSSGLLCIKCTESERRIKREKTNLEKYGTTCSLQNESIDKKSKETLMTKFGTDNVFKNANIQKKAKESIKEIYGVENPFASKVVIQKIRQTCKNKYGYEFPLQNSDVQKKSRETNIERYGVEFSSQAESVKEKAKETNLLIYGETHHAVPVVLDKAKKTNLINYGVEYSFQSEEVKDKSKETMLLRYGVEHSMQSIEFKEKAIKTCEVKYGASHPMKLDEFKEKRKQTCIDKYGVENPNQSQEIQEKSQKTGLTFKHYMTPMGNIRQIQGYENQALDLLFYNDKLDEEDILTNRSEVPRICYNDNTMYYFPDIFIPSQNKIIEVKSDWTYELHKAKNEQKREACLRAGYKFEFWIFDKKGVRTIL